MKTIQVEMHVYDVRTVAAPDGSRLHQVNGQVGDYVISVWIDDHEAQRLGLIRPTTDRS